MQTIGAASGPGPGAHLNVALDDQLNLGEQLGAEVDGDVIQFSSPR
jgi:hypothetical protein